MKKPMCHARVDGGARKERGAACGTQTSNLRDATASDGMGGSAKKKHRKQAAQINRLR
jgi:hypothetical protein